MISTANKPKFTNRVLGLNTKEMTAKTKLITNALL